MLGLQYDFMRHALLAGSGTALAGAAVGYFLVLRRQAFAAHALSHVGFTGAAAAILLGVSPYLGLFAVTLASALALALTGEKLRQRDVGIGMVLMAALGLGVLFLNLYTANAQAAMSMLFGSIVGVSAGQAWLSLATAAGVLLALALIGRPLTLSSLSPETARARGVPTRALDLLFMALVAVTVAIAVPVIGALLIFALLIGPAAAAQAWSKTLRGGLMLALALGLALTWSGLALAYAVGYPASTWIAGLSFALYLLAALAGARR